MSRTATDFPAYQTLSILVPSRTLLQVLTASSPRSIVSPNVLGGPRTLLQVLATRHPPVSWEVPELSRTLLQVLTASSPRSIVSLNVLGGPRTSQDTPASIGYQTPSSPRSIASLSVLGGPRTFQDTPAGTDSLQSIMSQSVQGGPRTFQDTPAAYTIILLLNVSVYKFDNVHINNPVCMYVHTKFDSLSVLLVLYCWYHVMSSGQFTFFPLIM